MELALSYALMDAQRRDDYRREQALLGVDISWRAFHESQEHKISVFAGRCTGKTYNLALRAIRSQYDCIIFMRSDASVIPMADMIDHIFIEQGIPLPERFRTRGEVRYTFENGRTIRIHSLPRNRMSMRGVRWANKEIFVDEFEHSDFQTLMDAMGFEVARARHIVCVGSINRMEDSYAKRWFKQSDVHLFIDSEYIPPTRGHMPAEYRPSIARQMIENLPPIGVDLDV